MSIPARTLLSREERVETIVSGAATAFAREGFAGTSMEAIAAEAGITKLILYRHFEGKQDIYEAVLARVSQRLIDAFHAVHGQTRSRVGLQALLVTARADPDGFLLLFRHAAREPQFAAYADGYVERVITAVETWLAELLDDRTIVRFSARVTVRTAIEAVIAWLEFGTPRRDDEFLRRTERALVSMVKSFAD